MKKLIMSLLLCFIAGCQTTNHTQLSLQDARQVTPGRFDKVVIEGPMDVDLIGGIPENDVRLLGTKNDIYRVRVKVQHETLILTMLSGFLSKQRLLAVVRVPALYQLTYKGNGHVNAIGLDAPWFNADIASNGQVNLAGKELHLSQLNLHGSGNITLQNVTSKDLFITSTNNDRVTLNGVVNLSKIRMGGTSKVKIVWVDSPELQVRSNGHSTLELAGTTGILDAMLRGQARLNARYLRSKVAYVKSYDNARADLQVTGIQNTLASDSSNIYFYKTPAFLGMHMADSGTVLDMDGMR